MAHLSGFGLENFRVFKDYTWFDFAPITILVGPNSSGKSSLIKALLLLKDNYERGFLPGMLSNMMDFNPIKFDGGLHNLSSGKNIVNEKANESIVSFSFPFELSILKKPVNVEFNFNVDDKITKKHTYATVNSRSNREEVFFKLDKNELIIDFLKVLDNFEQIENIPVKRIYTTKSRAHKTNISKINILKNFLLKYKYSIRLKSFREAFNEYAEDLNDIVPVFNLDGTFSHHQEVQAGNLEDFITGKLSEGLSEFIKFMLVDKYEDDVNSSEAIHFLVEFLHLENITNKLIFFKNIFYLPSIKGIQKRLFLAKEDDILNKLIKSIHSKAKSSRLQIFLSKWTKEFSLGGEIITERNDDWDVNSVRIGDKNLLDLGYGITQLTILLLMISDTVSNTIQHYNEANGSDSLFFDHPIIIIEEPEANLHPKLQSLLADMIMEAKQSFNIQFIIETHSEYMIRKFQYLIAKGDMKPEDIVIYYFNDPNNIPAGEKQVKEINVLEDGSLSDDFGPGFYDEAANWELELLKLKKNKTRQN